MKIRNPKTIRRLARLGSKVLRTWVHTLSYAYRPLGGRYIMNDRPDLIGDARYVYAFWHEYLFVPSYVYARPDTGVLIGLHSDGELLTHINESFGFKVIRGSSTRGGQSAMLRMIKEASNASRHFGITPDGPKGPRRKCQFGTVYLASRTGLPVVPVGFGYSRCKRVKNWDKFAVPMPFSRVRCVSSHPIVVPPNLKTEQLEPYQQALEKALNHATAVAEHWAETREFDPLGYTPPEGASIETIHAKAWPSARKMGLK
jgi:lysophospholipid acyltransferase (LPLAT)-like uncharacterized protein